MMERLQDLTTVPLAMQTPMQRALTIASLGVAPHLPVLRTSVGAGAALGLAAVVSFWSPAAHQPVPTWSEKHFADFVSFTSRLYAEEPASALAPGASAQLAEAQRVATQAAATQTAVTQTAVTQTAVTQTAVAQTAVAQSSDHRGGLDRAAAQRKLTKEQATLAQYLAKRYRVALDSTQEFVEMSYRVARDKKMDPWLILAIMGIESSFDPHATSHKGAQGLMQVLTRVHAEKFAPFGGVSSAFDPLSNIKVGAQILKSYIDRDGTIEGALKSYVGAAFMSNDGGYGVKVLTERERLAAVAEGRPINEAAVKASLTPAGSAAVSWAPASTTPASMTPVAITVNAPSVIELKSETIRTTVIDIKSELGKPGPIDLKGDVDKVTVSDSTDPGSL